MVSKTILASIIAIAFIAGSITAGSFVYAQLNNNVDPLSQIGNAINNLQSEVGVLASQQSHAVKEKVVHLDSSSCVPQNISTDPLIGWCTGQTTSNEFLIQDPFLTTKSVVTVTYYTPPGEPFGGTGFGCTVLHGIITVGPYTGFHVRCDEGPEVNSTLNYEITNP